MTSEVRKASSGGPVGKDSPSEIPTFSIAQGFKDLGTFFHPDKNYDYTYAGGGKIRLTLHESSSPRELEGVLFFLEILLGDKDKSLSGENFIVVAEACDSVTSENPEITTAQFATAVRKTLRDVNSNSGIGTTLETIPTKVSEQLMAILVFVKALPDLSEDVSKSADTLLNLMRSIAVDRTTDRIYYHIQNEFALFFQKDGSWTKTYNTWGLGRLFGYGI